MVRYTAQDDLRVREISEQIDGLLVDKRIVLQVRSGLETLSKVELISHM